MTARYGVTNQFTAGYAWWTDDLAAAHRCATAISGVVVDTRTDKIVRERVTLANYWTVNQ